MELPSSPALDSKTKILFRLAGYRPNIGNSYETDLRTTKLPISSVLNIAVSGSERGMPSLVLNKYSYITESQSFYLKE